MLKLKSGFGLEFGEWQKCIDNFHWKLAEYGALSPLGVSLGELRLTFFPQI
jgi:hypothetical protein